MDIQAFHIRAMIAMDSSCCRISYLALAADSLMPFARNRDLLTPFVLRPRSSRRRARSIHTWLSLRRMKRRSESLEKEINRLLKDGVTADEVRKAIAYSIGE